MNITQIENNLQQLVKTFKKEGFIYDLLLAYGQPKAAIKRIKDGGMNLSKVDGEIAWKKKLFFKAVKDVDLHELITDIIANSKAIKHDPRFVVVTDYKNLLAVDTKTQDTLDIEILDIAKHFDFFLPWAGMEKAQHQRENPVDVRAAEKMAKLYDDIKKDNPTKTHADVHNLNVFLSRLLFCFFADDTGIFEKHHQFANGISSHTQHDGSDLNTYLDKLFEVMNTEYSLRNSLREVELPAYLLAFPYVNGGLFRNRHNAPKFTRKSRQIAIDMSELDWAAINPDIFGSMIQAVITPEHRGGLGMHYTSVPNIMKVIEPLFLTELYEEFYAAFNDRKRLSNLLKRISNIKIFDPACGSGNFLIIAYKELRKLEIKLIKRLDELNSLRDDFSPYQLSLLPSAQMRLGDDNEIISLNFESNIKLNQFYGIEIDDFAHEVAILSLWLAEHQMNQVFFKEFGHTKPALPLKEIGNIVNGNATRLDWEKVCPKENGDEIYILGNPPYKGSSGQNAEQKEDMAIVFNGIDGYKNLDFIAAWFYKGAKYIHDTNAQYSFVSTNSVCQGEQVALLWPLIFNLNLEIDNAYTSFKWKNNAKDNAGVTVIIVCVRNINQHKVKYLFYDNRKHLIRNINPYLTEGDNLIIHKRSKNLSNLQQMDYGTKTVDGGNLTLTRIEKDELIRKSKSAEKYIKLFIGTDEFLYSEERFCLWIESHELKEVKLIPAISDRINEVEKMRLKSTKAATKKLALTPHLFGEIRFKSAPSIIIPLTTSELREYLPIGFLSEKYVVSNSASVICNAEPYTFSIISSRMHITWIKAVCGSLESRIRYSSSLGYNTFPFPPITETQKKELENHVYSVLEEREHHSEKTLAQLYDPCKMPDGLREAHHQLDLAVERCYRNKPFETDEERLEYLFKLYEQMIEQEKSKGTLFETEKKPKKK